VLNKKIARVEISDKKMIKPDTKTFTKALLGKSFFGIDRIGKLLIFKLSDKKNFLLIHLKMTGQLVYMGEGEVIAGGHALRSGTMLEKIGGKLPNKYTRLTIGLGKNEALYFNDLRKFGYAKIVEKEALCDIKKAFGIEPRTKNFTAANLKKAISGKKKGIKATLLDQKTISGLGNIYVDEALFRSGIDPRRKSDKISDKEIEKLHKSIEELIKKAVKYRGTTFSDYSDSRGNKGNFSQFLQVYGRTGEKCTACGTRIKKIREAGRGTHFCPKCQK
ncbi:bifunctional DNA-formamidopyrimidine glycosylase/DNA-(apurinic or apyrimidinic site) lyase, partial [Candidatus Falkowbacteria bacterium]|nr:bifunctional DNA-formamidopyrimidine glycosylase/DNA-(apurinic or apyrimidinic site) lyase [Candidatus Falkowbacteria bacterium]